MLRSVILAAARNKRVEHFVETAPVTRSVVRRFVAGTDIPGALWVSRSLASEGLTVSLDHLGEDTTSGDEARAVRDAYLSLLRELGETGLSATAEVSVKLSAVGQLLDREMSTAYAQEICAAAQKVGTTVTLDMEDHTTTDTTLATLGELRKDFPTVGAVLQAYLRRTEADCRDLASAGSRIRLCKGAYREPESVAFQLSSEVDRAYVRCMNLLLASEAYPMFATHDPALIAIVTDRASRYQRSVESYEFQMLFGVRPREQRRLAEAGFTTRIYVPYGQQWYGYLMRRLAERPANLLFFARAISSRG